MKKFIAVFRIFLLAILTIPIVLTQRIIFIFFKGNATYYLTQLWHKVACVIVGLKVEVRGKVATGRQIIYISNHLSYLDIPVVGSCIRASFVAKDDIASWPIIGSMGKAQQTAYISRTSSNAQKVAGDLDVMLRKGKSLILFPEGTSSIGETVLPFKSSLFSLAQPKDLPPIAIQPFIIELIDVDGKPLTPVSRDYYAWYGDMDFGPHIWPFLQTKGATVRLTFLDVIVPTPEQNRKELCKITYEQISSGLNRS